MRPPGSPKTPGSGRKKGTPNKVTLKTRDELWAYIDQLCAQGQTANPFQVLVDTMLSSPLERVQCAIALADRLLPKLKAVELSGDPEKPLHLQLTPEQRQARIRELHAQWQAHHGNGSDPTPSPEVRREK